MSNAEESKELAESHTDAAIRNRIVANKEHSYIGDFVLGAVDGAVTTFAIIAGGAGAGLSPSVAIVLGLANVVADGFSMAASNFLKAQSDRQLVQRFRTLEESHIDKIPDAERQEIREIFLQKGFEGEILEEIVRVITADRKRWVDTMLTEEWGLQLETPSPTKAAITTFASFLLAGMIPLAPLFFAAWLADSQQIFAISAVLTAVTFFTIGVIRGRTSNLSSWRVGFETLFIGGSAAALAYFIGLLLRSFVDVGV
ncbi:MAG: VIT1/CCC1 transporter family protein [bacterium]|nr:VIT1/CCC1 transporter family protein [bacterium]